MTSGEHAATFLLTDIEGSTRLWEDHPQAMDGALSRHDELVAEVAGRHGGRVVKARGEGDSAFVVFSSPSVGTAAALDLQRRFQSEPWPRPIGLRVRMALHCGPVEQREGDFYGPTVNRCARLRNAAHGGQVLLSDGIATLARADLPDGATLVDLGIHRLRDLHQPERVWQLAHADLASRFPPLATMEGAGHNLPDPQTSFVGRGAELHSLQQRLGAVRLVTLVGPGGAGKTRLAVELARSLVGEFDDGIWFADLSSIGDPSGVPARVAESFSLREDPRRTSEDVLIEFLAGREALLVLDNCEHVVEACAHLAQRLLDECPRVRILATTRELLRVYGEAAYPVPALAVPPGDVGVDPSRILEHESARLFLDRAGLADPTFGEHLDDNTIRAVGRVCRQLEGMPLAIELAAALLSDHDVVEIAGRLDERLMTLDQGPRTVPRRQQSLRAAIDWSHDLLSERERAVFRRVAVFTGGADEEAVAAVCAGGDVAPHEIPTSLRALADRSLLMVEGGLKERRYRMLETIREYAVEQLNAAGDQAATRSRHFAWYSELVRAAAGRLLTPTQAETLEHLEREHDNIRAAYDWGVDIDAEATAELAADLSSFWSYRGSMVEARLRLSRLLSALPEDGEGRAGVLVELGNYAFRQGDHEPAIAALSQGRSLARTRGDEGTEARATYLLAATVHDSGDLSEAESLYERAIELLEADINDHTVLGCINGLGLIALLRNDYEKARSRFQQALAGVQRRGDVSAEATIIGHLGYVSDVAGRTDEARSLYEEQLRLHEECGNRTGAAWAALNVGTALIHDDHDAALSWYERALSVARDAGIAPLEAGALSGVGHALRLAGRRGEATKALEQALAIHTDLDMPVQAQYDVFELARVEKDDGAYDRAEALTRGGLSRALRLDDRHAVATALGIMAKLVAMRDMVHAGRLIAARRALRSSLGIPELERADLADGDWLASEVAAAADAEVMSVDEALNLAAEEAPVGTE